MSLFNKSTTITQKPMLFYNPDYSTSRSAVLSYQPIYQLDSPNSTASNETPIQIVKKTTTSIPTSNGEQKTLKYVKGMNWTTIAIIGGVGLLGYYGFKEAKKFKKKK